MSDLTPEDMAKVNDYMRRFNDFGTGKRKECPYCDTPVEAVTLYEKTEPETASLYVMPCGCRLGLWSGAPDWVKADGLPITIVPSDYLDNLLIEDDD